MFWTCLQLQPATLHLAGLGGSEGTGAGVGGEEVNSRATFQIVSVPWEMLPRKVLVWTAARSLCKSLICIILY